jgi:hypothetical protein
MREAEGPCGSFDITSRKYHVDWPVAGRAVGLLSTHPHAIFTFRAARISNPNVWVDIWRPIMQDGLGWFCLPEVPGVEAWKHEDVVFQVTQTAGDGTLYQASL